jgi:hypothetical protein
MNGRDGKLHTISNQNADPLILVPSNLGIETNDGIVRSYSTDLTCNTSGVGIDAYSKYYINSCTPNTSKKRATLMDQILKKPLQFAGKRLSNLTTSNGSRNSSCPELNALTSILDINKDTIVSHRVAYQQNLAPQEPPSPSDYSHSRRQRKTPNVLSASSTLCNSSRRNSVSRRVACEQPAAPPESLSTSYHSHSRRQRKTRNVLSLSTSCNSSRRSSVSRRVACEQPAAPPESLSTSYHSHSRRQRKTRNVLSLSTSCNSSRRSSVSHRVTCEQPEASQEQPSPSENSNSSCSYRRQRKTHRVRSSSTPCNSSRRIDSKISDRTHRRTVAATANADDRMKALPRSSQAPQEPRGRSAFVVATKRSASSRPQQSRGRSCSVPAKQRPPKKQPLRPSDDDGQRASLAIPGTQPKLPSSLESGTTSTPLKIVLHDDQQQQEHHHPCQEARWKCSACHCIENESLFKFCVGCGKSKQTEATLAI